LQSELTEAQALFDGVEEALDRAASRLLKPLKNNFVERPWGGMRIREYKGLAPLPEQRSTSGMGLGEAFEIAAFDADPEAAKYPSRLRFDDGSEASLPELLDRQAEALLGAGFVQRFGSTIPLLPKTLDVGELLSIQGHPEGNTEVYIIIEAEPGATIRLGFREDVDAERFKHELLEGRRQQEAVLAKLGSSRDPHEFQALVAPWLAARDARIDAIAHELSGLSASAEVLALLEPLKRLYWRVLDSMNEIPVRAGQVIHNANPERITAMTGRGPSAEVHALGNPEGKEILALEIRRPGPTFRAWDNVRFPIRDVDVAAAVDALNLRGTRPEEFIVEPVPVGGSVGVYRSIDSAAFRVEHLRPTESTAIEVAADGTHCLHAIRGSARVTSADGAYVGSLDRGESAIVPERVGAYRLTSDDPATEIVKVSLPDE
jgi:mannose-6-phosphate isomerase class I